MIRGPRLSCINQSLLLRNLDFVCSYPRLFLMVLIVYRWIVIFTVSRKKCRESPAYREGEMRREKGRGDCEMTCLNSKGFSASGCHLLLSPLRYSHCLGVPGETLRSFHVIHVDEPILHHNYPEWVSFFCSPRTPTLKL